MTREQIIEILKFYEDPAEDLNHNCRGMALFSHLYEDVADEILSLQVDEWVSVEERLPEDDLFVIVWYGEADSFGIASYKDETWCESLGGWEVEDMVTHWKELYNKPPKTEK